MRRKLTFGRYDYAACMTFAIYAVCSMIIPMSLVPLALDLGFPLEDGGMSLGGALQLGRAIPMVVAMVFCGFAAGWWGKRRTLGFSILFMAVGIMACALAPAYGILFIALVVSGLGEGVIEGLTTPFIQDLHPDQSGRYLNLSHSFWSVGVLIIVLTAGALMSAGVSWRLVVFASGLLAVLPSLLFLLPDRTLVEHEDQVHWKDICAKTVEIIRIPRFWLFFAAMFFAGGGEFCLTFWCASFIQLEYGGTAWIAGMGTASFAIGMFVGRIGSGYLVGQGNLKKLIVALALSATVVCLAIPWVTSVWWLFVFLFLSGIAAGPFWPSIQSDGVCRIKGDCTMMMILFSCAGVPGCGFFTTLMGIMGDWIGLRMSFFLIPACFLIVFILMGYDLLAERSERLTDSGRLVRDSRKTSAVLRP